MYSSVWKMSESIGKKSYVQSHRKMIHHAPLVVSEVRHIHYPLCWGLFFFPFWWISTELPILLAHLAKCGGCCSPNNRKKVHLNIWKLTLLITEIYIAFWERWTQILKITTWYYMQIYMLSVCLWLKTLPFIEQKHSGAGSMKMWKETTRWVLTMF